MHRPLSWITCRLRHQHSLACLWPQHRLARLWLEACVNATAAGPQTPPTGRAAGPVPTAPIITTQLVRAALLRLRMVSTHRMVHASVSATAVGVRILATRRVVGGAVCVRAITTSHAVPVIPPQGSVTATAAAAPILLTGRAAGHVVSGQEFTTPLAGAQRLRHRSQSAYIASSPPSQGIQRAVERVANPRVAMAIPSSSKRTRWLTSARDSFCALATACVCQKRTNRAPAGPPRLCATAVTRAEALKAKAMTATSNRVTRSVNYQSVTWGAAIQFRSLAVRTSSVSASRRAAGAVPGPVRTHLNARNTNSASFTTSRARQLLIASARVAKCSVAKMARMAAAFTFVKNLLTATTRPKHRSHGNSSHVRFASGT